MTVDDPDPVWVALRLVSALLSLAVVVLGVRVAVTRRFPVVWVRAARLTESQRSQPLRRGGFLALLGASLLVQQVPLLAPVPAVAGRALFALALLLLVGAVGWFVLLRR
ncbi:hypothetical protein ACIBQ2_20505 [Micromonospora sediminimaris]|uniref:Uncharacterized protein n=1 Tax=Micromonospora sediminimaris TaxID=547162 RepID=A0A9W5UR18_9ACTN|nr:MULTISPECIES: hypothetical protein [Micromonospora]WFE45511.1 hypothetical protein O7624_14715 [Verrucosispora sp. WMMD1129]GIJ34027.1 hypothetical protein Vse01_31750 [Micromonospora sediminimaris]SFC76720.1 hypothetical protein SAMN05216284_10784 [Micromonospora sediminimaris]